MEEGREEGRGREISKRVAWLAVTKVEKAEGRGEARDKNNYADRTAARCQPQFATLAKIG